MELAAVGFDRRTALTLSQFRLNGASQETDFMEREAGGLVSSATDEVEEHGILREWNNTLPP